MVLHSLHAFLGGEVVLAAAGVDEVELNARARVIHTQDKGPAPTEKQCDGGGEDRRGKIRCTRSFHVRLP